MVVMVFVVVVMVVVVVVVVVMVCPLVCSRVALLGVPCSGAPTTVQHNTPL